MSLLESLGRLQARAVALLVAVFAAGVLAGVGLGRLQRPHHHGPPRAMALFEQLDLTPEQREKVDAAIQRHRGELDVIFSETRPRVHTIQKTIETEVRAVLTPEQLRKLDALEADLQRRAREGGLPPLPMLGPLPGAPPPPGPPPGAGGPPPP